MGSVDLSALSWRQAVSRNRGILVTHIGRVVRAPQKGYCFIEDVEGGDTAFLHISRTVEGSLDNYRRGSYVEFDPQPGAKGVEAHNARVLTPDEVRELGLAVLPDGSEQEKTLAEDVDGIATGPVNENLFAACHDYGRVFVGQREFVDAEQVSEVIAGTTLHFDVVMTDRGPQARRVRVAAQPRFLSSTARPAARARAVSSCSCRCDSQGKLGRPWRWPCGARETPTTELQCCGSNGPTRTPGSSPVRTPSGLIPSRSRPETALLSAGICRSQDFGARPSLGLVTSRLLQGPRTIRTHGSAWVEP